MIKRAAYIALGANLVEPARQVGHALKTLANEPDIRLIVSSRLYRSTPVGPPGQDDYCNAVCAVETLLSSTQLLRRLQGFEVAAGRTREGVRWGPRVLDLDLLHVVGERSQTPELTLPHPRLHERNFVLVPLAEIAPELVIEGVGVVAELVERVGLGGLGLW